jgi:hypothetical protein
MSFSTTLLGARDWSCDAGAEFCVEKSQRMVGINIDGVAKSLKSAHH